VAAGVASYSGASSVVLGDFYLPVASSVLRFAAFPWSFSSISLRVSGVSSFHALCNMAAWQSFRDRLVLSRGTLYGGLSRRGVSSSMLYGGVPCCGVITSCCTAFCGGAAFRVVAFCRLAFLRRVWQYLIAASSVDAAALRCGGIRRIQWHPIGAVASGTCLYVPWCCGDLLSRQHPELLAASLWCRGVLVLRCSSGTVVSLRYVGVPALRWHLAPYYVSLSYDAMSCLSSFWEQIFDSCPGYLCDVKAAFLV
ncbi:18614_t:CDS:2, partial [Acaulospora morrowiae]